MRGGHVFKGYFKNEAATKETIDPDGWLLSGDVGKIDDRGFLKIKDRKKELIITAGGENIPPQILEGKLKAIPVISQAVVISDRHKFITALFTLYPEKVESAATEAASPAKTSAEATTCKKINAYIQAKVEDVNRTLASPQAIKQFVILAKELSVEGEELTPAMKLKRRTVYENSVLNCELYTRSHSFCFVQKLIEHLFPLNLLCHGPSPLLSLCLKAGRRLKGFSGNQKILFFKF